jgi:O-antigen/teichoic acid export membrane protein
MLFQVELFYVILYLGYVTNSSELGLFSAAQRLVGFVWGYGLVAANRALLPILSSIHAKRTEEYSLVLQKIIRIFFLIALIIGIVGSITSYDLIRIIYGDAFKQSGEVLQILVWMLVIGLSRAGLEIGMVASNEQLKYLRAMILLAGLHVVLVPIGYYLFGLKGSAYGMVVAELFYALYLLRLAKLIKAILFSSFFLKGIVSMLISFAVVIFLPVSAILQGLIGSMVYCIILVLLHELKKNDLSLVCQTLGLSRQ